MEARNKTAVGDITASGLSDLDNMSELQDGQLYVGDSIILGNLTAPPARTVEGMIMYNQTTSKLQFFNGTWVNAGS